jgi:pimeloyl-ACP methyl ester carboxylesterase
MQEDDQGFIGQRLSLSGFDKPRALGPSWGAPSFTRTAATTRKSFRGAAIVGLGWYSLDEDCEDDLQDRVQVSPHHRQRLFDRASRVATWTRTAVDRSMLETRAAIESRPPLDTSTLARKRGGGLLNFVGIVRRPGWTEEN